MCVVCNYIYIYIYIYIYNYIYIYIYNYIYIYILLYSRPALLIILIHLYVVSWCLLYLHGRKSNAVMHLYCLPVPPDGEPRAFEGVAFWRWVPVKAKHRKTIENYSLDDSYPSSWPCNIQNTDLPQQVHPILSKPAPIQIQRLHALTLIQWSVSSFLRSICRDTARWLQLVKRMPRYCTLQWTSSDKHWFMHTAQASRLIFREVSTFCICSNSISSCAKSKSSNRRHRLKMLEKSSFRWYRQNANAQPLHIAHGQKKHKLIKAGTQPSSTAPGTGPSAKPPVSSSAKNKATKRNQLRHSKTRTEN